MCEDEYPRRGMVEPEPTHGILSTVHISTPRQQAESEWSAMMNRRKFIRPNLSKIKERTPTITAQRKQPPPDRTFAENYYYVKQMKQKTTMVLVLNDGEKLNGVIEWYDQDVIKLNRKNEPNVLILKASIKYLYKKNNG